MYVSIHEKYGDRQSLNISTPINGRRRGKFSESFYVPFYLDVIARLYHNISQLYAETLKVANINSQCSDVESFVRLSGNLA